MTDKERLEEISNYYTMMHESDFESNIFLGSDDVYWLIEQAERVEKLEKQLKRWEAGKLIASEHFQENKRYREALEFYADYRNYDRRFEKGYESMVDIDGGHRATEALEESE